MYQNLIARETACAEEKDFIRTYNEYVRRKNAGLSDGYIAKAWRAVKQLFDFYVAKGVEWVKNFTIIASNKVLKALTPRKSQISGVEWVCEPIRRDCQQLYLIELLNARGELVWSKVGTTTRNTEKRMKEHLQYYAKDGITSIRVNKVWECDTDAEGFESFFRAYYIRKYPGTFQKNDRFYNVEFDLTEAQTIFDKYVNMVM